MGGLPENVTEEIIGEAFANFGMIVSIRKGKKNFCHIRYEMEESVDRALFLSGQRKLHWFNLSREDDIFLLYVYRWCF